MDLEKIEDARDMFNIGFCALTYLVDEKRLPEFVKWIQDAPEIDTEDGFTLERVKQDLETARAQFSRSAQEASDMVLAYAAAEFFANGGGIQFIRVGDLLGDEFPPDPIPDDEP